jgi:hypothetical protein
MVTARIFISTVSNEFKTCRERLAEDLQFPNVDVQTQEKNITKLAAGQTILIKLDDYIAECDVLIHLIGQQTSIDGTPASKAAVDDLLQRHADLSAIVGLGENELRTLSYTQWEAWLALYHRKTKRPNLRLIVVTPTADFVPDNAADAATSHAQKDSQASHAKELQQRGRWPEIRFTDPRDLSIGILRALKDILPGQQPQQRLSPPRFIHHAAEHFLGREPQLALLDEAWINCTNVLSIIAWGGVGKTALITEWVQTRFIDKQWKTDDGQPALAAYFDWTFYDQGTRSLADGTESRTGSVGDFFEQALVFFGDPDPNLPGKGHRLADLIRQQRSLIILDGLEPLQQPPGHPQAGRLLDPDLRDLLAALAQSNPGLCLITSREPLKDLDGLKRTVYVSHDLEDLPVPVAVQLLKQLGINGTDKELTQASEKFGCHALSLTLLGRYIVDAHGGDIRQIDNIRNLQRADILTRPERHRSVWRILETYESWLATARTDGSPTTLAVLRLTGLFDRTATADCLAALRAEPIIPCLTDAIYGMADDEWNILLKRLERAHLIKLRASSNETASNSGPRWAIDAHPLIREYFAKQLKDTQPEAFEVAHSRLFDHLCQTTELRPASLIALEPLYQAIAHGCNAMRQPEAFEDVFIDRILRGIGATDFYSSKVLGACASDLSAIRSFLEAPWPHESRFLLGAQAAIRLRSLGQMSESVEMMRREVERQVRREHWNSAARLVGILSDLEATAGLLALADESVARAADYAAREHDSFVTWISVICAANVELHKGNFAEALNLLAQNYAPSNESDPRFSVLASITNYKLTDLQLSSLERTVWMLLCGEWNRANCDGSHHYAGWLRCGVQPSVLSFAEFRRTCDLCSQRVQQNIVTSLERGYLLDIAFDRLSNTLACFYYQLIELERDSADCQLGDLVLETLNAFRQANELAHLPLGLLTAAFYHGTLGENLEEAERLLEEAQQIAERGPMPLYLADVHLHRARLFGRMNADERKLEFPDIDPKAELREARRLIEKHCYWRRREELEDAEAAAIHW